VNPEKNLRCSLHFGCTCGRLVVVSPGGMAERSMAPVLKTGNRKVRGFESYFLRGSHRGEVAELA
jgi:hypothetical protein